MANLIKCPTCGENTPAGQEFCQYCQSPLKPSAGNEPSLRPGQAPTQKITSELESALPQWLKDARASAQQSYQEEPSQPAKTPQATPAPSTFSSADLLAGLQSQSQDEEEDIPDWLANITGEAPKPQRSQASSEVRWVEFGGSKDFTQPVPKPEPEPELPPWMSTPPAEEKDELTDWLRAADASQQAPQAAQPFSFDAPPDDSSSSAETPDWLHSMVSDSQAVFDDSGNAEETFISSDTPGWLRGLETPESSGSSNAAPAFTDTSDWPKAMDEEKAAPQADFSQATPSDTPDWLKAMDAENAAQADFSQAASSDAPDWLKAMDAEKAAPSDTPDWLKAMDAEEAAPQADFSSATPSDTPDWLKAMDAEKAAPQVDFSTSASSDTPDWLKAMDAEKATPQADFSAAAPSDTPDWLKAMDEQGKTQSADSAIFAGTGLGESDAAFSSAGQESDWLQSPEAGASASDQDWLKGFQSSQEEKPASTEKPAPAAQPSFEEDSGDLPSWLKAAAPQSSIFAEPPAQGESLPASVSAEMPDWFNTAESAKAEVAQPAATLPDSTPPVSAGAQAGMDADSLFTELPDWLSIVDQTAPPDSIPSAITNVDAIAPGELPSWVQAMRPVDAGISQAAAALSADKTLETRGALAGLQGVLPAAPGYAATSKPKAYSIKLQASEEQLSHAALLEQILSAETSPVPIGSFATPGTSRALRWSLVFLFFVILPVVLFMRTQIFVLPNSVMVPLEVGGAVNVVQSIPQDAPVLVIFDYEPSRAGEVETVAVPVLDQLLLKRTRLTFISTKETGVVLVERLISTGYLAGHENVQYINMGYLPGGQMGIRAFAENPVGAMPYVFTQTSLIDFGSVDPWTMPPLAGVNSLPQFAALILVTDDADSARAWIEQTQSVRDETPVPFVVISSAQTAPMLQPYFASGQISGLVSGLHGGALFEQRNNQKPGTARAYWDAYSIGILFAMALILGGGLLNLALGLRDRAVAREAK